MEEAKRHNCTQVFSRFKAMVEGTADYNPSNFQYGFGPYIKKEHSNCRSVFTYKDFQIYGKEVRCYLALRVFMRGDNQYDEFILTGTSARKRETITALSSVNWDQIQSEIESELSERPNPPTLSPLSDAERAFVQRGDGITHEIFSTPIYESKEWVDTVCNGGFDDWSKVSDAFIDKYLSDESDSDCGFIEISYGDRGEKILCYRLREADINDSWFLLALGVKEVVTRLRDELELEIHNMRPKDIRGIFANRCRRAYPLSMFNDKDFWRQMEKDKDSNFILSDEEIGIVSNPPGYPLFISGRAGSGKSTVLQYLFAEFLLRYLSNAGVKPPVYLSYSVNLIDNAKKLSTSLFDKNYAYTAKLKDIRKTFKTDVEPLFDKTFFVFRQLVRECIGEQNKDVLDSRFQQTNCLSYTRYRELWNSKFGRERDASKKYGPALSWHVIRTYIKGWDSEAYLEPDDYTRIGRSDKSVSDSTFKLVFDKVWRLWYQKLQREKNLWDDQDLVRYCVVVHT